MEDLKKKTKAMCYKCEKLITATFAEPILYNGKDKDSAVELTPAYCDECGEMVSIKNTQALYRDSHENNE